jgi:hypothetical protein
MRRGCVACLAVFAFFVVAPFAADDPKPKRVNRAIELLEQGQPIYYTGSHEGTDGSFEQASRMLRRGRTTSATTWSTPRST